MAENSDLVRGRDRRAE